MPSPLLLPLFALLAWTLVIWAWMNVTSIPAMVRLGMRFDASLPPRAQSAALPPRVRWKIDNYNHLLEQPTAYYAAVLGLVALGDTSTVALAAAWAYAALRVAHSLVQVLVNAIAARFALFTLSTLALAVLVARGMWVLAR